MGLSCAGVGALSFSLSLSLFPSLSFSLSLALPLSLPGDSCFFSFLHSSLELSDPVCAPEDERASVQGLGGGGHGLYSNP